MSQATIKRERVEARVSSRQKELFQRAAEMHGQSLSDFIVASVQAAAEKTIRSQQVIELTERSTEAFVTALLSPPAPGERLRAAARDYRESVDRR